MKTTTILLSVFVAAVWGLNAVITKAGTEEVPPLTLLLCRYFLTSLFLLPFAKLKLPQISPFLKIAFLESVLTNGCIYIAFKYLSPASSTLLLQTGCPVAVCLACLIGREKATAYSISGIVLAIAGAAIILGMPEISLIGCALILLSRLSWGYTQLLLKDLPPTPPLTFIFWISVLALPFLLPVTIILEGNVYKHLVAVNNIQALSLNLVYQVVFMSAAMFIWQKLIASHGVNTITPFSIMQIVFGILGGTIWFGDVISINTIAGTIAIIGGVIISQHHKKNIVSPYTQNLPCNQNHSCGPKSRGIAN